MASHQSSSNNNSQPSTIKCFNPATLEVFGEIPAMNKEETEAAILKASQAQKEWKNTTFNERRKVLQALLDYIVQNQDEICRLSCQDSGKTLTEAGFGEVLTSCEKIRYTIKFGEKILTDDKRYIPLLLKFTKKARVEFRPYGVIGIIIPWNYPFHNMISHIVTAIFSGNAAAVKVSEWASWSSVIYGKMIRDVIEKCGHNPDIVQVITGYGETGAAVVKSPNVGKILFIGSDANGRRVMTAAAESVKPVVLELGGKDPLIICDDADLDKAIPTAMRGVFVNCGQNCIAAERIFVQDGIYEEFVDRVSKIIKEMRQGDPLCGKTIDSGAMTMPNQVNIVENLVKDAVANGAKVVVGGKRNPNCNGQFFEPTLLVGCKDDMKVITDEAFGPIMSVLRWKTDEEVIERANSSIYGLASSVFSTNYKRAENIASQLVCGCTVINDFGIPYLIQSLPFGGVKASGFGKFNGPEGMKEFVYAKVVVTDRFGIRSPVPAFSRLPAPDNAYEITKEVTSMIYNRSYLESAKAAYRLCKKLLGY